MRRPNTTGTRGGQPQRRPLPLAEPSYNSNDEQQFRRQLQGLLDVLQTQVDFLTGLVAFGTFTMAAANTKTVDDVNVTDDSVIVLSPTNAAAGTLQQAATSLYILSKVAGASFTVKTANAGAAAGTETFGYVIVG